MQQTYTFEKDPDGGDTDVAEDFTMTKRQMERVAYGAVHAIVQQVLDNGELHDVDYEEFMPDDWFGFSGPVQEQDFISTLQQAIETLIMSNLHEEAAKRDG